MQVRSPSPARASLALAADVVAAAALLGGLAVLAGGGGRLVLFGVRIGLHHAGGLLWLAFLLLLARWHALGEAPLLGTRRLGTRAVAARLARALAAAADRLRRLDRRAAHRWLAAAVLASLALKALLAIAHPGFLTGDDVEVQEQSLAPLLGHPFRPWDLRSPVYPVLFVRPVQAAARAAGLAGPEDLVVAGRLAVALWSCLGVLLLHAAARRLRPDRAVPLLAAWLLAISGLAVAYGSSVLPRSVAGVFVLAGYLALLAPASPPEPAPRRRRPPWLPPLAAGLALAAATAVRFSEAIFLLPALLHLALERRFRAAWLLALGWALGTAAALGPGDLLVWDRPFHSLAHIVRYTLLRGESSRGLQPPWHYLQILGSWTTLPTAALFVAGLRRRRWRVWLWALAPLLVLSLLPHKEARYLVPVLPFVCLGAAHGLWDLLGATRRWWTSAPPAGPSGRARAPLAWLRDPRTGPIWVAGLILLLPLLEADGYRLDRTDAAVAVARRAAVAARAPGAAGGVLAERSWRYGGWIHLGRPPRAAFLDPAALADPAVLARRLASRRPAVLLLGEEMLRDPARRAVLRRDGWPVDQPPAPGTAGGGFRLLTRRP